MVESCCIGSVTHTRRWKLQRANDSSPITASLQGVVPLSNPRRAENASSNGHGYQAFWHCLNVPYSPSMRLKATNTVRLDINTPLLPHATPKHQLIKAKPFTLFCLVEASCPIDGTDGFKAQTEACFEPTHNLQQSQLPLADLLSLPSSWKLSHWTSLIPGPSFWGTGGVNGPHTT
jgi:hypothetical protein